ncbi:hypothetical protein TVAG_415070 [Trichomonas vaginalis G3]|uniref:Uncharacterized protein n=1 Tax=Trichomonas vaginalis (strain ATCC PRA-98 / G3) TaxID=412133 RepID=A2FAJ0_TRIV3|nr:hypothetical protein TVAGG3_0480060 [Trichomonas vaginalis G3]EAX98083.1 hypothetical protein TVAG_415070 [Trichomonas vaginalis G3]KAI5515636.1 hypothetical protein TVAGG3_0480060 [Trichomonas vaginalis G3]|eukprot:XP_001311013.1 hypothetical protein [Trichomonas vaginalis G3]
MNNMKSVLTKYSPTLRRDFLAILVKLSAKKLQTYTVRNDWRTKTGMLEFLQRNWDRISNFIEQDPAINWFCINYTPLEKIFTDRKFALFIQDSWDVVGRILSRPDVLMVFKYQIPTVLSLLESKIPITIPQIWTQYQASNDLFHVIEMYKNGGVPVSPQDQCEIPRLVTTEEIFYSPDNNYDPNFDNFEIDFTDQNIFDQCLFLDE